MSRKRAEKSKNKTEVIKKGAMKSKAPKKRAAPSTKILKSSTAVDAVDSTSAPKQWPDWLEWGKNMSAGMFIKTWFGVTVGEDKGTYQGEWKRFGSESKPHGRGALRTKDHWMFGYFENGDWADESDRIVLTWNEK